MRLEEVGHHRRGDRAAPSTCGRSTRRWSSRAASSATSSTWWACGSWSGRSRTATPRSARSTRCGCRCRAGSRTTSPCPSTTPTSRCTRRWWGRRASSSRCRSAPGRWTCGPAFGVAAHWRYKAEPDELEWLDRMIEWQSDVSDPSEFMANLKVDLDQDEVVVFTPKGEVVHLPAGADAGRLRLRHPHPDRPQVHRRQGRRLPRRAVDAAALGPDGRDLHGQDRRTPARRPTGSSGWPRPRPRPRSASGWPSSGATRVLESGPGGAGEGAAGPGPAAGRGHGVGRRAAGRGRAELRRPRRRSTGPSASATSAQGRRRPGPPGAGRGRTRGRDPADLLGARAPPAGASPATPPACTSRAWTTCSSAWPAAARRCRPTRSWASTPGAGASPSTGPTAPTPCRWPSAQKGRLVEVEWDSDGARQLPGVGRGPGARPDQAAAGRGRPPWPTSHINIVACQTLTGADRVSRMRFDFEVSDPSHLGAALATIQSIEGVYSTGRVAPACGGRPGRRRRICRRARSPGRVPPRPEQLGATRADAARLAATAARTSPTTSASATSRWVAAARSLSFHVPRASSSGRR